MQYATENSKLLPYEQKLKEEWGGENTRFIPIGHEHQKRGRRRNMQNNYTLIIFILGLNGIVSCLCIIYLFNNVRQLKSQILAERAMKADPFFKEPVIASTTKLLRRISESAAKSHDDTTISNCIKETHTILILYLNGHAHQQVMAEEIQKGVLNTCCNPIEKEESNPCSAATLEPRLMTYENSSFHDVLTADAVILGSPVYNANVHPDVQSFINTWDISHAGEMSNKVGAAFVTAGGISAGEEGAMLNLMRAMLIFQMICIGGDNWEAAFGASAIVYEDPFGRYREATNNEEHLSPKTSWFARECYDEAPKTEQLGSKVNAMFLKKAFGLGARVGRLVLSFNN